MKKKSILLTCIVAIMALAMFVGCDNAPTLPSFVVSGRIDQIGDILSGQAFDASKFSVTVTYDNGRIVAADETVSVMLNKDSGNTVEAGDEVIAYVGKNYESQDVYAKASVKVYNLSTITVEGPASVVLGDKLTNSDFTVTANYGEGKTMVLDSTEFIVGNVEYANDVKPTAANPSVKATVTVTPLVGNKVVNDAWAVSEDFTFDCTYEATGELPGPVEGINIALKKNVSEADIEVNVPAMEDVYPSYDDFAITFDIAGMDEPYAPVADPGVVLTFVDEKKFDLDGDLSGLTTSSTVYVKAEYEDFVTYLTSGLNVVEPKLTFSTTADFSKETYVSATELPAVTIDSFSAVLEVGSEYEVAPNEAVTFAFYDADGNKLDKATEAGDIVYIKAEYRGVVSSNYIAGGTVEAADPVATGIQAINLATTFKGPAKQQYTNVGSLTLDSEDFTSIVLTMSDGKSTTIEAKDFGNSVSARYSSTDAKYTALPSDLSKVDNVYVEVTYSNGDDTFVGYKEVATVAAVATDFTIVPTYDEKDSSGNPMFGTDITLKVTTSNALGVVAENQPITTLQSPKYAENGFDLTKAPATVDDEAHTYIILASLAKDGDVLERTFTVPAGTGYIDVTSLAVTAKNTQYMVGDVIDPNESGYEISAGTWSVEGSSAEAPKITAVKVPYTGARVPVSGSATVTVTVSYLAADGTVDTVDKTVTITGKPYANVDKNELRLLDADGNVVRELVSGETYKLSVDPESYENFGKTVAIKSISTQYNNQQTITGTDTIDADGNYAPYKVVVEWVNGYDFEAGKETTDSYTFELNVVAAE